MIKYDFLVSAGEINCPFLFKRSEKRKDLVAHIDFGFGLSAFKIFLVTPRISRQQMPL